MQAQKHAPWSSEAYTNAASFVPHLATKVQEYLFAEMKGDDVVVDIGCGDGVLTAKIAEKCKTVVGLDASASMIESARSNVGAAHSNAEFYVQDCRSLAKPDNGVPEGRVGTALYDKAFSNAAMHWILRDENTRESFFHDVAKLVKPGGLFIFEMGGPGNVADAHTALLSVLHCQHGVPLDELRRADPWFFATENWAEQRLSKAGFKVEVVELQFRPTKMTTGEGDKTKGLEGWIRLMGAPFLDVLPSESEKDRAVESICKVLSEICRRPDEAGHWISNVRLRAVARKQ